MKYFLTFLVGVFLWSFLTAQRDQPPRRVVLFGVCLVMAAAMASYRVVV